MDKYQALTLAAALMNRPEYQDLEESGVVTRMFYLAELILEQDKKSSPKGSFKQTPANF